MRSSIWSRVSARVGVFEEDHGPAFVLGAAPAEKRMAVLTRVALQENDAAVTDRR